MALFGFKGLKGFMCRSEVPGPGLQVPRSVYVSVEFKCLISSHEEFDFQIAKSKSKQPGPNICKNPKSSGVPMAKTSLWGPYGFDKKARKRQGAARENGRETAARIR